ncbi:MAG: hypothetical protein BWY99_02145 [Synergistetes bacterium ADurb.BinA166]|nr:MAG: hypothetical protein BWY99_02145 [Synergistetes bacterium ADurb.BinA166]
MNDFFEIRLDLRTEAERRADAEAEATRLEAEEADRLVVAIVMEEMCDSCGKNRCTELAPCPFKSEIRGDLTECACCYECQKACADEI